MLTLGADRDEQAEAYHHTDARDRAVQKRAPDVSGRTMRQRKDRPGPGDRALQRKVAACVVCERRTRGSWRRLDDHWIRLPTRHKAVDGGYCVGSYEAALIGD